MTYDRLTRAAHRLKSNAQMKLNEAGVGALMAMFALLACGGEAQHGPTTEGAPSQPDATAAGGSAAEPKSSGTGGNANPQRPSRSAGAAAVAGGGAEPDGDMDSAGSGGAAGQPGTSEAGAAGEPSSGLHCDPIVFEDADLEHTVRVWLQKFAGPLRSADVSELSVLTTESITSLKGVECLTALTSLDVGSLPPSHIVDLSPLASLRQLEELSLSRNPIASLEPLGKLPRLKSLYMFKVPVPLDLAPLAGAPALEFLDMDGDTIENLGPLGAVSTLRELQLRNATIVDPASIGAVQSLESLDATGVFHDAAPLANLTELQKLRIGHAALSNFSALGSLTKLKFLDVSQTGISDISAVSKMTKLVGLNASGNQISDLAALALLPDLSLLDLIANQISDLGQLAAATGLNDGATLYLQQNPFACAAAAPDLQAIQARGVSVNSDCP